MDRVGLKFSDRKETKHRQICNKHEFKDLKKKKITFVRSGKLEKSTICFKNIPQPKGLNLKENTDNRGLGFD